MNFHIGDPIFNHTGEPGVVAKNSTSDKLSVDTDQRAIQKQFRHGYIKGLNEESRNQFYAILDEVHGLTDPKEKVAKLQSEIQALEQVITPKARQMLGYLKAEMAHIMNSYHYQPRFYEIPVTRVE